jgi:hypothetical protein
VEPKAVGRSPVAPDDDVSAGLRAPRRRKVRGTRPAVGGASPAFHAAGGRFTPSPLPAAFG